MNDSSPDCASSRVQVIMYAMSCVDYFKLFHVNCHVNYLVKQSIALSSVSQPRVLPRGHWQLVQVCPVLRFRFSGNTAWVHPRLQPLQIRRVDEVWARESLIFAGILVKSRAIISVSIGDAFGSTSLWCRQLIHVPNTAHSTYWLTGGLELEDFMTHRHPAHGSQNHPEKQWTSPLSPYEEQELQHAYSKRSVAPCQPAPSLLECKKHIIQHTIHSNLVTTVDR